jgi:hypothetical protein
VRGYRAGVVCAALILLLTSCYQWRPVELGPTPIDAVRLGLESSEVRVDSAYIAGDTVRGVRAGSRVAVPVDSVVRYEQRDFDWVTSAGVAALIVTGWICIYPGC